MTLTPELKLSMQTKNAVGCHHLWAFKGCSKALT